jgi:putative Holliday junction resolvase
MVKYLCLDLGTKTIGIAKSDLLGFVYPKEEYRFETGNYLKARQHIIDIVNDTGIRNIVIGWPLQIDRKPGNRCESVMRFTDDLREVMPDLHIFFYDESYSTTEARYRLQEMGYKEDKIKEVIDMYSAVVILEDYLRNKPYDKRN